MVGAPRQEPRRMRPLRPHVYLAGVLAWGLWFAVWEGIKGVVAWLWR